MKPSSKSVLRALLLVQGAASCSDDDSTSSVVARDGGVAGDTRAPTPPEWDRAVVRPDDVRAASDRTACTFARGALPDETLGASTPVGGDIPVDTIVVVMQENRSFDHYFSRFGRYAGRTDVESAADDATNPEDPRDPNSPKHGRKRAEHLCFSDTSHTAGGSLRQYDDGKMDGFFVTNQGTGPLQNGDRALGWYDEKELPYYYALAKEFGIADHYFCSFLGPSSPNRMFLVAGTSFGATENTFADLAAYPFPERDALILDELEKRHVDWKLYSDGPTGVESVLGATFAARWRRSVVGTLANLLADAAAGTLPAVSFFDANFNTEGSADSEDEHPPGDVQIGQRLVSQVIGAVMKSPQWKRSAVFLTYDEHGGLYDHVPPPNACPPNDGSSPIAFERYGFRVPLIVVSPYAKHGYVSHQVYDHTSILRFIEARFRLPALTSRDANAAVPLDFFDFASPPRLAPPALPEATIDPWELAYCRQTYPKR